MSRHCVKLEAVVTAETRLVPSPRGRGDCCRGMVSDTCHHRLRSRLRRLWAMPPDAASGVLLHLPGAVVHHAGAPAVLHLEARGRLHVERHHMVIGMAPYATRDRHPLVLTQEIGHATLPLSLSPARTGAPRHFATRYGYGRWLVWIGGSNAAPHMWSSHGQLRAVAVPESFGELLDRRIVRPSFEEEHGPPCVLRQTCRQHRSCCANTNHNGIVAHSTPSLLPSQVRRWDYNREVAAVEGKMEGSTIRVVRSMSCCGTRKMVMAKVAMLLSGVDQFPGRASLPTLAPSSLCQVGGCFWPKAVQQGGAHG